MFNIFPLEVKSSFADDDLRFIAAHISKRKLNSPDLVTSRVQNIKPAFMATILYNKCAQKGKPISILYEAIDKVIFTVGG